MAETPDLLAALQKSIDAAKAEQPASSTPTTASEDATLSDSVTDSVTSSDGDRGLSEWLNTLLANHKQGPDLCEWCDERSPCSTVSLIAEVRAGEAEIARILAGRTAQPDGVERVEWGHRYPDGSLIPDSSEAVAKSRAAIRRARGGAPLVVMRRVVGPWEVVGDE